MFARLRVKKKAWATTGGVRETANISNEGDFVVKNLTESEELYIVTPSKFSGPYEFSEKINEKWSKYEPLGKVKTIDVDRHVLSLLKQNGSFHIYASWGHHRGLKKEIC